MLEEKTYGLFDKPQNKRIFAELKSKKHKIYKIPVPEKIKSVLDADSKNTLANLYEFDWIIFKDVFTVEFFIDFLTETDFDLFELDNLRICSYGEAVADKLRFSQIHSDVIAEKIDSVRVLQQIKEYIFDEEEVAGTKFLLVEPADDEGGLSSLAARENLRFKSVKIYELENLHTIEFKKFKILIKSGAIDKFIISSPEDVFELAKILGWQNLESDTRDMSFVADNEISIQTLKEFGLI